MFLSSLNIYDVDDDDDDDDDGDDVMMMMMMMMMTFSLFSSTSHLVSSFITTS